MLELGDDELIGHLARLESIERGGGPQAEQRRAAVSRLARGIYDRDLWQVGAESAHLPKGAPLRDVLANSTRRQALERMVAYDAGVDVWSFGIYPPTRTQKSLADVLVVEHGHVKPIADSIRAGYLQPFTEGSASTTAKVAFHRGLDAGARGRVSEALTVHTGTRWQPLVNS